MTRRRKQKFENVRMEEFLDPRPPDNLPVVATVEHQAHVVLSRLHGMVGYRSHNAMARLFMTGPNSVRRWLGPDKLTIPHSRHWLRLLEHVHWSKRHDYPFHMVRGYREDGKFEPYFEWYIPDPPECEFNWLDDPLPIPKILRFISDDSSGRYKLPFMISARSNNRPAEEDHLTRVEWVRLGELFSWFIYGYKISHIWEANWKTREVSWTYGKEPRSRSVRGLNAPLQLPVNPMELIDWPQLLRL